ncbi:MAG: serine/threonine protein kinase [Merdibacter sp.]
MHWPRNAHQERIVIYDKERRKLFEQGRKRFRMEAAAGAVSKESAIITVYHTFEENDTAYLVMEYDEGDTNESLVKRDGVMSAQQVREIMIPLLTVLNKVHEKGIIHRDIAPDNIYITKDGKVKLLDFGAAYSVSATAVGTSQSISMIIKRGYAPQEQYRSPSLVGPYSDVYSAAATMYYAVRHRSTGFDGAG